MKDKIGQEIKPGAIIAYGHALGRCAGLRIGKVLEIDKKNRVVVWGVNDDWSGLELNSRKSTLYYPNRMVVLPEEAVDKKFKDLFETIPALGN